MNGIEKNNVFNMVQPLKSKSSYYQKNNKSFEKVMKDSQSLQTVQPKENNSKLVENNEDSSDIKKLEKLIEDMIGKIDDVNVTDQKDMNSMVDLLSLLQSFIQKQLESSIQDTTTNKASNDSLIDIPDGILLTDSKGFMNAIMATNDQQSNKVNQLEELKGVSSFLSTILSKLMDTIKSDVTDNNISKIDLSESELKNLMSVLGQFLDDKGLNNDQVKQLTDRFAKIIAHSQLNIDSKATIEKPTITGQKEAEVDTVSMTKITTSETESQSFSSSNQAFSGDNIKQFALFIGKTTNKAEANQFVRDFQNIIQKSTFTNEMGQQKIFIKLFPENLGRISIELVKNEHGMTATIIASSVKAKELLQSNMDGLKQALQLNNLQVEKIDLYQSLQTDNSSYLNRERDQKQQNQQQKQSNQSEKEEEFSSSFLDEFLKVSL